MARAPTLHLAHRLDRDTTGVLLVSKNPAINPAIQAAFIRSTIAQGVPGALRGRAGRR